MLRIEKELDGGATILRLSGRIQATRIHEIEKQMDDGVGSVLDLAEVTLVDVDVVRFLSGREEAGVDLVHCPAYIRAWILRERIEIGRYG